VVVLHNIVAYGHVYEAGFQVNAVALVTIQARVMHGIAFNEDVSVGMP